MTLARISRYFVISCCSQGWSNSLSTSSRNRLIKESEKQTTWHYLWCTKLTVPLSKLEKQCKLKWGLGEGYSTEIWVGVCRALLKAPSPIWKVPWRQYPDFWELHVCLVGYILDQTGQNLHPIRCRRYLLLIISRPIGDGRREILRYSIFKTELWDL